MSLREKLERIQQTVDSKAEAAAVREAEMRQRTPQRGRRKLSEVGDTSSGQLACPKCGGTNFKAKRKGTTKALLIPTIGVGALLAPKSQVQCVTCGTVYRRG